MRGEQQPRWGVPLRRELVQPATEDRCHPLGQRGEAGVGRDDVVFVCFTGAEVMREGERVGARCGFTHSAVAWRIETLEPRVIVLPVGGGGGGGLKYILHSNITIQKNNKNN